MTPSRVGALVVVLLLGLLAAAAIGLSESTTEMAAPMSPPEGPVLSPEVPQSTSSVARLGTTVTTVVAAPTTVHVLEPVEVARGGLAAWGRFAASSDLDEVAPWFSPEGPQWERFVEEGEGEGVGPPAYIVSLTDQEVSETGREVIVTGRVVFTRTGEASQSYRWRIVLVSDGDEWRIWTVEEAD